MKGFISISINLVKRFTKYNKRSLALLMVAVCFGIHAQACVDERPDHNYYMFSVFNRNETSPVYLDNIAEYWKKYVGDNSEDVYYYSYIWNKENILKTAQRKKDIEMQTYLKRLNAYLDACDKLNTDSWDYAAKQERQKAQLSLNKLANAAKLYKGSKLKSQYALLRMRINMVKNLNQQNITYWNTVASKLPQSMWREAMYNIYARALWKTGKRQQALDIYAEQGDIESIKFIASNYRNLAGIQSIYLKNPNSQMLAYLVQDFVNNSQQTIDSNTRGKLDKEWIAEIGAKVIYQKEAMNFITFANKVIAEGKTQSPCLWRSATAMLHYLYGEPREAWKESNEAMTMNGTQRMKDNARAIRLLVSTQNTQVKLASGDYSTFLVGEFKWLDEKAREEDHGNGYNNHYTEVLERVAYRGLYRHFRNLAMIMGHTDKIKEYESMATAMYGMMDAYEDSFCKDEQNGQHERNTGRCLYSSEYAGQLDSLTAQQLVDYYTFITAHHEDAFEEYVCQSLYRNADAFHDLIGTKYLAEGNFSEAARWLKDVSLPFINQQAISYYSSKRSYDVPYWFNHQKIDDDNFWSIEGDYAQMKENPKLKFCQEMNQLIGEYNVSREGEAKDELAYQLAVRYYQASCYGDCWYLTHYGKSICDSARSWEADFAAIAQKYLKVSKQSSNIQLRYHSLIALASIDIDPWYKEEYDENWNRKTQLRPLSAQYQAMEEWSKFSKEYPQAVDNYTTKCDVLKQFEKEIQLYQDLTTLR